MSTQLAYSTLLNWCREAPLDTGTALVEDDYWGFYAANATLETSWFAWFPTRDDLLRFLADCWPFDYHASCQSLDDDPTLVLKAARFGVAVMQYEAGEIDEDLFLALLSEVHPGVTLHWIGTFEEMLYGDVSFAREWRADFRGMDITEGDYPIEGDEYDDALRAMAGD